MPDLAIRVEGLGKQFRIGAAEPYQTLRGSLVKALRAPLALFRREDAAHREAASFWALRGVSFDVLCGEAIGIIGRNGAGKSTLLKILSRITEPTEGRAFVHGRMSSLLEVGTGFHAELTGRENIFLNGAILGMKRAEIIQRFDEIVAFAEVERFVDTPVKHYSSGMLMRLAFSVAAHLEPDILVVDEVLAVGDASFQRKCLAKMEDVGKRGRAVLFVSHNMQAVTRLCSRVILLEGGRVVEDGPSGKVVGAYLRGGFGTSAERRWDDPRRAPGNHIARLMSVRVVDESMTASDVVKITRKIGVEVTFEVLQPGRVLVPGIHLYNDEGVCIFIASDVDEDCRAEPRPVGTYAATAWIPGNLLAAGAVAVGVAVSTMDPVEIHIHEKDAVAFQVVEVAGEISSRGNYGGPFPGIVRPRLQWETRKLGARHEEVLEVGSAPAKSAAGSF